MQGRVLYDIFIYTHTTPDGKPTYLIEYDSRSSTEAAAPPLLSMLKRYVLRSKVKLRDVSEEYDVWATWGSQTESEMKTEISQRKWSWARSGAVEPDWSGESEWPWGVEEWKLKDRRAVGMGSRILVKKGDKREWESLGSRHYHRELTHISKRMLHA
jgi:folate-binding Fe-S cluster repair protein YgfZ